MIIGLPRERKVEERRMALLPDAAAHLVEDGHTVLVEAGAGSGIGIADQDWIGIGARIVTREDLWAEAGLVVKVKEPQADEWPLMRPGQIVFGYFHLAPDRRLAEACLRTGITALAFETLVDARSRLPLLRPMSEIAGRLAVQFGARFLEAPQGGPGILLGGVAGVAPAEVVVLGGGVSGQQAALVAAGMGARVTVLERDGDRIRDLAALLPAGVAVVASSRAAVRDACLAADLVIGCVLVPGALAPHLIDRELVARMRPGAVLVDVAIDQGGCAATSRPTTHRDPVYTVDGVVHCCVANMPGAVARTASRALSAAVLPYARELAAVGADGFCARSSGHAAARNVAAGRLSHPAVIAAFPDLPC
jgi:alanine dehydrogenase